MIEIIPGYGQVVRENGEEFLLSSHNIKKYQKEDDSTIITLYELIRTKTSITKMGLTKAYEEKEKYCTNQTLGYKLIINTLIFGEICFFVKLISKESTIVLDVDVYNEGTEDLTLSSELNGGGIKLYDKNNKMIDKLLLDNCFKVPQNDGPCIPGLNSFSIAINKDNKDEHEIAIILRDNIGNEVKIPLEINIINSSINIKGEK